MYFDSYLFSAFGMSMMQKKKASPDEPKSQYGVGHEREQLYTTAKLFSLISKFYLNIFSRKPRQDYSNMFATN